MQCENNCLFFMNCYLLSSWFSLFFEELKTWIELKKFVHKLKNNLSLSSLPFEKVSYESFPFFRHATQERRIDPASFQFIISLSLSPIPHLFSSISSLSNFYLSFLFFILFLFLWFLSSYLKCLFPFTFYFSVTLCFNFWILFIISLSTRRQFECQFRFFFSIIFSLSLLFFISLRFFICLFSHPSLFTSLIPSLGQSLSPPAHKCI